jgi:hypothetical protein
MLTQRKARSPRVCPVQFPNSGRAPASPSRIWLAVVILLAAPTLALAQQANNVQPQITAAVDSLLRVTIPQSKHPLAQPGFDAGPLDGTTPMQHMILVLGVSLEQDRQLTTFLDSQQTPGSPDYHNWITPDQFGQRFGPAPQDIQTVTGWLQQQGFTVDSVARSGRWIEFSGTSAQVEAAFQTQMRHYQVNGEAHVANASNISLPAALAPVVRGVASLHNFFSKPMIVLRDGLVRRMGDGTYATVSGDTNLGAGHGVSPADFAKIYDVPNLLLSPAPTTVLNGTGQTIAIVARTDIRTQDVTDFRTVTGLGAASPTYIINGEDPGIADSGDQGETTLDTEWTSAVAPGATIDVVISGSTLIEDGVNLSSAYIVENNLAPIMSLSFGGCENSLGTGSGGENAFWNALWQQAAAQGISVFASSGDDGAAGCDPNEPVPSPGATGGLGISGVSSPWYVTAVGGTEFNESIAPSTNFWNASNGTNLESAAGYMPEKVWNESCSACKSGNLDSLVAGGGGVSIIYTAPPYQTLNVTGLQATLSQFAKSGVNPRGVPDVSLTASAGHDGYLLCLQASCASSSPSFSLAGGTSASTPAFAGIMALVNQKLGGRQGLANYVLYSLAAAETYSGCNSSNRTNPATGTTCVFNDNTVGNNGVPGNDVTNDPTSGALGYPTGTGYDLASGLGSVDGINLINAWNTAGASFLGTQSTITSPASINVTHGASVSITGTVAALAADHTALTPTGNVAFIAQGGTLPGPVAVGSTTLSGSGGTAAASGSINDLPGGTYTLVANYPGDGTFAGSGSTGIAVTVAKEAPAIELIDAAAGSSSPNNTPITVSYGTPIDFEVFVTGLSSISGSTGDGAATGMITFTGTLGSTTTNLSSALPLVNFPQLNAGYAEFFDCSGTPSNCLAPGTNKVNGSYPGDNSYNAGNSGTSSPSFTLTVTVNPAATTTTVSSPSGGLTVSTSTSVTLNAALATSSGGISPTGTVTFFSGSTQLGSPVTVTGTAGFETFTGGGAPASATAQLVTTLPAGTDSITAVYNGNSNYAASPASSSITITATPTTLAATTTTVVGAPSTITLGQNVTLTATVMSAQTSPAITGTVIFSEGSTTIGSALVSSGQAALMTTSLPPGSFTIKATYGGDTNYATSFGTTTATETVNQITTTTTVSGVPNPSTVGQSVTLTATVTPTTAGGPTPTGTVQFSENGTNIGTGPVTLLANGTALLTTTSLPVGSLTIKAAYSGDTDNAGSTGTAAANQVVNQSATTTTVISSAPTIGQGTSVTFTATITPTQAGGPTLSGTVQFSENGTNIGNGGGTGPVTVSAGQAVLTTTTLPGGTLAINAVYSGDTNYITSTGSTTETVKPPTTTTISGVPNPSTFGQSVTLTATVSSTLTSPAITGTVQFSQGGTNIGAAVTISGGQAHVATSTLAVGSDTITATYSGDANFGPSSGTFAQTVNKITTTDTVVSSALTITVGTSVTFTATLTPASSPGGVPAPTGTVTFFQGTTSIGNGTLASNTATLTTTTLPSGSLAVKAMYNGDANYLASALSAPITETVNPITTTTAVVSSAPVILQDGSVMLTATITPASSPAGVPAPTGTVQFSENGTNTGTPVTVSGGKAVLTTTTLPGGVLSISAVYSGDANYSTSTSSSITQTVSSFTLTATPINVMQGQTASSTLTITSVGSLAGNNLVVTLNSCTGLSEATCSFNATMAATTTTVNLLANGTATATFFLDTTAAGTMSLTVRGPNRFNWWTGSRAIALAAFFFMSIFLLRLRAKERRWSAVLTLVALAFILTSTGCAPAKPAVNPGTPIGNGQLVMANFTIDGITQTASVTVNVAAP